MLIRQPGSGVPLATNMASLGDKSCKFWIEQAENCCCCAIVSDAVVEPRKKKTDGTRLREHNGVVSRTSNEEINAQKNLVSRQRFWLE